MQCPRCSVASLHEIDKDGITLDRCDRCRGIWLDRGELEKLLARGKDAEESRRRYDHRADDDDDDDRRDGRHGERRRWWDIFD